MSALEKKPELLASTPDEDLGPGIDWRGILRSMLAMERNPEARPQLQMRTTAPAATVEDSEKLLVTHMEPGFS